jgi:hypothetical protein
MIGPILLPIVLGIAGWFAGDGAGLVVGVGTGLLVSAAVVAAAAWWARTIGDLLEPEDALANAPRPPGFGPLCDWVYGRVLAGIRQ